MATKLSWSCPALKPLPMVTVAEFRVRLSTSLTVSALSMATGVDGALSPATKAALPPEVVRTGASFTATTVTVEARASAVVSTPPLATPPVSLKEVRVTLRLPAVGLSLRLR